MACKSNLQMYVTASLHSGFLGGHKPDGFSISNFCNFLFCFTHLKFARKSFSRGYGSPYDHWRLDIERFHNSLLKEPFPKTNKFTVNCI